jgi:small subunit ribosomal protein S11
MAEVKEEVKEVTTEVNIAPAVENDKPKGTKDKSAAPKKRKKVKRSIPSGQVHIQATFNNTIITFTDDKGNVLTNSSAGANGFRGSKKGTAYAAQVAAEKAGQAAKSTYGFNKADVFVKGIGLGRDAAVRAVSSLDIQVDKLVDVTGVPHGGVRPKKARRV